MKPHAQAPNVFPPRVNIPFAAVVEARQQYGKAIVSIPGVCRRPLTHTHATQPIENALSRVFTYTWDAFCSARRVVYPKNAEETKILLHAEDMELQAAFNKVLPVDYSLAPRRVGVSLVLPSVTLRGDTGKTLLDAFAALSDGKMPDGSPITVCSRFTVYSAHCADAANLVLGIRHFTNAVLVLRWAEPSHNGVRVRTEQCFIENSTCDHTSETLQSMLVDLAETHSAPLPPRLYAPVKDTLLRHAEQQVADCSSEFFAIIDKTFPFVATQSMKTANCEDLVVVKGLYLRLVQRGNDCISNRNVTHAIVLCGIGRQEQAETSLNNPRLWGRRLVDDDLDAEMLLHVVCTFVEPVCLNGMVSLFSIGGAAGAAVNEPGTLLHSYRTTVLQMTDVLLAFDAYLCKVESVFPVEKCLCSFMETHMKRALNYFHTAVSTPQHSRPASTTSTLIANDQDEDGVEEKRLIATYGAAACLACPRTPLGTALELLKERGESSSAVNLLAKVAARRGCCLPLHEAFDECLKCMNLEEERVERHAVEAAKLKRIADAALAIGHAKKARISDCKPAVTSEKVRKMIKFFNLYASAKTSIEDLCSRDKSTNAKLAATIVECADRKAEMGNETEAVMSVLSSHPDLVHAVGKALSMCNMLLKASVPVFVVVHGHDMSHPVVFDVAKSGMPRACGLGLVFEAEEPRVLLLQFKSESSALVTALVERVRK